MLGGQGRAECLPFNAELSLLCLLFLSQAKFQSRRGSLGSCRMSQKTQATVLAPLPQIPALLWFTFPKELVCLSQDSAQCRVNTKLCVVSTYLTAGADTAGTHEQMAN